TLRELLEQQLRKLAQLGQKQGLFSRRELGKVHERARAQSVPQRFATRLVGGCLGEQRLGQRVPNALAVVRSKRGICWGAERAQRPIAGLPINLASVAFGADFTGLLRGERILGELDALVSAPRERLRARARFRHFLAHLGQRRAPPKPIAEPLERRSFPRNGGEILRWVRCRLSDSHGRDASRLSAEGQSELSPLNTA